MVRRRPAVIAVVLAATLAACTSPQDGTPTAEPSDMPGTSPASSTNQGDTFGAPRVSVPLDATKYLGQPCAVLSTAQLAKFKISKPGEPDTDSQVAKSSGPGCSWRTDGEPFRGLDVSFLTGNKKGLTDIYRGYQQLHQFSYFEETTVDGYPAVFADGADGRSQGSCDIKVGISDTLAFRAGELGGVSRGAASCDGAKELAAAVIATLKGGA
ncbi:MAG: DUF3558 domain-containing protein [Labedaea sp.]